MVALNDVNTCRGHVLSSNIGLLPSVLPTAESHKMRDSISRGVSTSCAFSSNNIESEECHWYVLRTTYGREKKAYEFIIQHNGVAFLPTVLSEKVIKGKKVRAEVSRIPNVLFAYGTEKSIKSFVYDNVNLPYLRFYYNRTHTGPKNERVPLIVPNHQMASLMIICGNTAFDTFIVQEDVIKFQKGEKVRVNQGAFEGVIGVVARFHGQQRVGLVIDGLVTAVTAYIPTAFLERIQ